LLSACVPTTGRPTPARALGRGGGEDRGQRARPLAVGPTARARRDFDPCPSPDFGKTTEAIEALRRREIVRSRASMGPDGGRQPFASDGARTRRASEIAARYVERIASPADVPLPDDIALRPEVDRNDRA
jgi:hypothetical protein